MGSAVGAAVGVAVGVAVGSAVGDAVGVAVGVGSGVSVGTEIAATIWVDCGVSTAESAAICACVPLPPSDPIMPNIPIQSAAIMAARAFLPACHLSVFHSQSLKANGQNISASKSVRQPFFCVRSLANKPAARAGARQRHVFCGPQTNAFAAQAVAAVRQMRASFGRPTNEIFPWEPLRAVCLKALSPNTKGPYPAAPPLPFCAHLNSPYNALPYRRLKRWCSFC